ncbi:MAG: bifunctional heptose 7-phosphate kinase/heptose 1-phosphate adenyltransferase [Anaerolineae bacterium]
MDEARLRALLARFSNQRILVLGDYFLDRYLILDPALAEISLETGRTAHQVVAIRNSPGAAGTVTNNLCALGVNVTALGILGEDGMGYELLRAMQANGVDTSPMIRSPERFTPSYTKPMEVQPDGTERETERQDIKNRSATPEHLERRLIGALEALAAQVDGIIVADQVPEEGCGVVTPAVRAAMDRLAEAMPEKIVAVDSRVRIGLYRHQILKPNEREAWAALHGAPREAPPTLDESAECGLALHGRTGRPVFLTIGERGVLAIADGEATHVPAPAVPGPIDIVGAGDSAMAAIASALCAGATPAEAASIANLVASITIQQLGTTGTATREQVLARFREVNA